MGSAENLFHPANIHHLVTDVSDRGNITSLQSKKLAYRAKKPYAFNPSALQGILNLPRMVGGMPQTNAIPQQVTQVTQGSDSDQRSRNSRVINGQKRAGNSMEVGNILSSMSIGYTAASKSPAKKGKSSALGVSSLDQDPRLGQTMTMGPSDGRTKRIKGAINNNYIQIEQL